MVLIGHIVAMIEYLADADWILVDVDWIYIWIVLDVLHIAHVCT